MATLTDPFTATNGTLLTAHTAVTTWTSHVNAADNNLRITGGRAYGSATGIALVYAAFAPASADYDVEAAFVPKTVEGIIGVLGRINTAANTFYSARYQAATTAWELVKLVAGTATTLDSAVASLTLDQSYAVKLEMRGSAIKMYVDGVEVNSATDGTIGDAGRAGIRSSGNNGGATDGIHLDNFTVTDAVAAPAAGQPMRMLI